MRLGGEALKEEIRRRVDLVDLASSYVTLRKAGRYYKGLCPFHQEKTPSFHIDRERGLFHCFGCGAGGDLFDFVMRVQRLPFPEALEELARRAGVEVERSPEASRRASEQERLYQAMEAAVRFFEEQVRAPAGERARVYLKRRGVDEATARRFRLGCAPEGWDALLRALQAQGFPPALLERCGLAQARTSGQGHFDLFRHRLIFPILDLRDRPIALGGRALDDGVPKYLNSPETPLFAKGRTLYALSWARDAIRTAGEIVIVEGYMDALTCHQFGVGQAVASLGTALTLDQVLLCKRFAPRAILVYDSDDAGMAATERAMELFEEAEVEVRIAVLPGKQDPDAYLRDQGEASFRALLAAAKPIFDYRLDRALARHDAGTVEGKVAIADEVLPVVAAVGNAVRQAEYLRQLAERFSLREDALRQRLKRLRRRGTATPAAAAESGADLVASRGRARQEAERLLLTLMMHDGEIRREVAARLGAEGFVEPAHREIAAALLADPEAGPEVARSHLRDESSVSLLTRLLFSEEGAGDSSRHAEIAQRCLERIEGEDVRHRLGELQALVRTLEAVDDRERLTQVLQQIQDLQRRVTREGALRIGIRRPGGPPRKGGEEHA